MLEDSSKDQATPRFKRPQSKANQTIDKISMRMDQLLEKQTHPSIKTMGEHEMFGAYVGQKLKSMPRNMAIYCTKIINEAIFYAEIGNLNINSGVVTSLSVTSDVNSISNSNDASSFDM
ncbi:hypothetical protein AVEN_208402-1 [Araneus ventricosus]|uniref:Uncharacterized protein n=1 Tax=Araneus ventricosus TaxID=182803 RepID=A0A4Y2NJ36_ARAVE|nr:hypothetical protein AVEN_208402-1 [Araneus ventricosus]